MDITFIQSGLSLFLLIPVSDAGKAWVDEHVEVPDWSSNRSIPVEPRYVDDIVTGAQEAGLEVTIQ